MTAMALFSSGTHRVCDGSAPMVKAATIALPAARPAAIHIAMRKPSTNEASRADCSTGASSGVAAAGTSAAASLMRSASNCSTTRELRLPAARRLSSSRLNSASTMTPIAARASRPDARDTALLMPDATPASPGGTELITTVTSGVTEIDIPSPITRKAGKNVAQYRPPVPGNVASAKPPAVISGPATSSTLGPRRGTSAPAHRDRIAIVKMKGSQAAPAWAGV